MNKKLILLTVVVVLSAVLTNQSRAENPNGTCGDNCNWVIENGTLTITGGANGELGYMDDYESSDSEGGQPWMDYKSDIENIDISGIEYIGNSAFHLMTNVTNINIGNSVVDIGEEAFNECKEVSSLVIPDSVENIGYYAFGNMSKLESVVLSKNLMEIADELFEDSELKSVIIPENVEQIGYMAFYGNDLTSVIIPDGVTYIGGYAFDNNDNLSKVILPDSISGIGDFAFGYEKEDFERLKIICKGNDESCKNIRDLFSSCKYWDKESRSHKYGNFSDKVVLASESQCIGDYGWDGTSCTRKDEDGNITCASGYADYKNKCWDVLPFAKKHYTPAEAAQWLNEDDNTIVLTFKK